MKSFSLIMLLILIAISITGCGEETADPTTATKTEDALFGSLSEMKELAEMASGAPSAPTDGTPFVKSVGYYSDWQLTEELDSEVPVPVGTTIYIKVVFSEAMKHRITDNPEEKGALPVLRYWVNSEVTRFRIMQHGAGGEDFVSGDAKPKGSGTDDFVCKYKVKAGDKGSQFWILVGEWSMDLEWNKLKESYTHETKLKFGEVPKATQEPVAVKDEVKKSEPTTGTLAEESPETDFVGWVYTPKVQWTSFKDAPWSYTNRKRERCTPIQGATVVIVNSGKKTTTTKEGKYIFKNITEARLHLRVQKTGFETKEVLVHRSGPTALVQKGKVIEIDYEEGAQKKPGVILIGLYWPKPVRPILQQITVIDDLLCIEYPPMEKNRKIGFYMFGIVTVQDIGNIDTIAHEIAHAHQDAHEGAGQGVLWQDIPAGKAYIEAGKKDLETVGETYEGIYQTNSLESAAETCAYYWWSVLQWKDSRMRRRKLEKTAPNRFKWAEKWVKLEK